MLVKFQRVFGFYLKVLRLSTFCAIASVFLAVLVARSVYGSTTASLSELNQKWTRRAGAVDKQQYRILLNGQAMMISSHMADQSIHEVLEAANEECRAHTGGLDGDFAKLPGVALTKLTNIVFGVERKEWVDHGYVACFERDGNRGIAGLANDLRELVKSGDVSKLGTFRYVQVDRAQGATKTHVLRQWTEGEFSLTKMFPVEGDVPGTDLVEVPRPDGARRILEAGMEGSPFGVRMYDAPGAPDVILGGYQRDLAAKGWAVMPLPEKDALKMRVFSKGDATLFITASPEAGRTVVSLADMPPS
jgi:hypothetical protein